MSIHAMIDLETLGTGHDASILSIGAVLFNPYGLGETMDRFHVAIDPKSCQAFGLKIDAETVMWWLDPARGAARAKLFEYERVDLASALDGFISWFGHDSRKVWSNGANFDIPIMKHAFAAIGRECPWKFWDERCYRSLKSLSSIGPSTAAHDALADAIAQARVVQTIARDLKLDLK